ncbi:hypothetical protein [Duganella sp. HH105]|uniref:hypothetical protein n=1 Tax=Duganella sp. HH105 TaxID=1781067 RepID=UPI000892F79A|nr:hypothetical protein [Duganella sp. HH105]OEZ63069.1 hypothetical protein DUGA6_08620 [Duganella sp. HH105]
MDTSKQKPDLMSSNRPAADSGKRILANLEHGPRPAAKAPRSTGWTIDGWTIGLGLLLATMCTVAWLMHERTLTPSSFARSRDHVGSAVARRQAEPDAPAAVQAEQPAAIVNEIVARPPAAVDASPMPRPAAVAQVRPETPHVASTSHKPAAASSVIMAGAANPRPTATRTAASAPATSGDTDVALLTALVAHAGKPAAVLPERSRDVVERQEGDSTAQLLARCKQLGLIEGMLCRSRICSGRWDADPACNAPAH